MIKSRKMILYTTVIKQLHAASCLSVSPNQNWQRPKYSVWCLPQLHIMNVWIQKPNPRCQPELALHSPQYSDVSSHHHHHLQKLLKDMTASTVSNAAAGRSAAGSEFSFLMADIILPPGKRIVRVKRQPCSVRCESETRTYVEFCGLPQKSSSSGNGSDSDNNRKRHIIKTLERS